MNKPSRPDNSGHLLNHLSVWLVLDFLYLFIAVVFFKPPEFSLVHFFIFHGTGIVVASLVMFAGLGAGVLWMPILTFLNIPPSEAVFISILNQIAGKGIGSLNYFRAGMIDLRVVRCYIPMIITGVFIGFTAGFAISRKYEILLLYIYIVVAVYLLIEMLASLFGEESSKGSFDPVALKKGRAVAMISSFFTGLLGIGNCDWLIPHMERRLKMSTASAIATGIFMMFIAAVFFFFLALVSFFGGIIQWPENSPILPATMSGVVIGGQIGTRLSQYAWLREHQKHAFILMLALSIIHLLW